MSAEPWTDAPILAIVTRSGFVEGHHHGAVAGIGTDGSTALSRGPVTAPIFGRSTNKPLQAVALLRAGAELDDEGVALACASHSGETVHLDGVRRMLAAIGLNEHALANTPSLPLNQDAQHSVLRAGGGSTSLMQNCSGKHAGMLAACVASGWPTDSYLETSHPLQVLVADTIADLAAEPVAAIGVDGCAAPVHAVSTLGLARAFRRLATADPTSPEGRVAAAMQKHPHLVGGTGRDVTRLMLELPGLVAKDGAEGVYAAALPDGRAVALKIDDGAGRARTPVLVTALAAIGVDVSAVADLATTPVLGGGRPVGAVRAVSLL